MMVGTVHVQTGLTEDAWNHRLAPNSTWSTSKSARPSAVPGVPVNGSSLIVQVSKNIIIPSKMEVSTTKMSYDFKMSPDYNYDVLKL